MDTVAWMGDGGPVASWERVKFPENFSVGAFF